MMPITDAMVEAAIAAFMAHTNELRCPDEGDMRAALEAAYPELMRENEALRRERDKWKGKVFGADTIEKLIRENEALKEKLSSDINNAAVNAYHGVLRENEALRIKVRALEDRERESVSAWDKGNG